MSMAKIVIFIWFASALWLENIVADDKATIGSRKGVEESTASTGKPDIQNARITLLFTGERVMNIVELREAAVEALKIKGFEVDEAFTCSVNIPVNVRNNGCVFLFFRQADLTYYHVTFDTNGTVVEVHQGVRRHGGQPVSATLLKSLKEIIREQELLRQMIKTGKPIDNPSLPPFMPDMELKNMKDVLNALEADLKKETQ